MRVSRPLPARYRDDYVAVCVDVGPSVETSVGPRFSAAYRWKCARCGKVIKQNTAAAQSHLAMHVHKVLEAGTR